MQHAIIIGSMKCGTSSLYDALIQHPQICACKTKEPEFFSRSQHHGCQEEEYSLLWHFDPAVHRVALEASTGYTKFPTEQGVPKRIWESGLRPKFLYVVRDPFDRIESHYNYMVLQKGTSVRNMDDPHLVHVSDYYLQLSQFLEYFDVRDIRLIDFNELKSRGAEVVREAADFLGLDIADFEPQMSAKNATRVPSPLVRAVRRSPLGAIVSTCPESMKKVGRGLAGMIGAGQKKRLSEEERAIIHDQLLPGMTRLREVFDFDTRIWGFLDGRGPDPAGSSYAE